MTLIVSSDKDHIAELEARLAQAQSILAEKTTNSRTRRSTLAASVQQVREKDAEIIELKE
jgi:hypothetical protein